MIQITSFTFSPIQENTYVLHNEMGEACIVDPGCFAASEEMELARFLEKNSLTVKMLLQTHCHLDHVFGLKWAANKFGLQPWLHPQEELVLKMAAASGELWGLPFDAYTGPWQALAEGRELVLGTDKLEAIFVPGHSPGHVCFYNRAQHFLIGGDVLFRESIGRTDLPGGNHQLLLSGIREKLFVLPGHTVVHPGHGPATTIGYEMANNPFLQ
jgi:glyoxylase-like metal-dependent hydrolase (beta-lactamase superfamily II)